LVDGDKNAAAVKAVETRANFMMVQEAKGMSSTAEYETSEREREREKMI
jgi:hypothetical protein